MPEATWVLTRLQDTIYCGHIFTCSKCRNSVQIWNECFTDKGEYDMTAAVKSVLQTYPYCFKCGSKMHKDTQIRAKMTQHRHAEKAYRKYAETYRGPRPARKDVWTVDEIIALSDTPM